MTTEWYIHVRDKPGVLWAFLEHFAGNAVVSFEGNLASLHLEDLPGASTIETGVLHRHTRFPLEDFVTIPVTNEVVAALKRRLAVRDLFPQGGALVHVQIQRDGEIVFGAYDNFHRDCVVARSPTPEDFLDSLLRRGVIRSYEVAA